MFEAFRASTADWALEAAIERLRAHPEVVAVARLGSTAGGLAPWSDYDLLVVTEQGPDFDVELTWIAHRPTDVIFTNAATLARLRREGARSDRDADLTRWIAASRSEHARGDDLAALRARGATHPEAVAEAQAWFRWVEANATLVKARRWLAAEDASYAAALALLLRSALAALPRDHVVARGHAWDGERDAVARIERDDPGFLAELAEAARAEPREAQVRRLASLIERAFAPVGSPWGPDETAGGWRLARASPRNASRWEALIGAKT